MRAVREQVHPTVSPGTGDILQLIKDGKVLVRPGIERVEEHTVHFTDGTTEDVDIIVCATGQLVALDLRLLTTLLPTVRALCAKAVSVDASSLPRSAPEQTGIHLSWS